MIRHVFPLAALLLVALPACQNVDPVAKPEQPVVAVSTAEPEAKQPTERATDGKQFGAPLTETKTTPLATLVQDPQKFADQTVRTEGVVKAVCKSMGCWLEIGDDAQQAHVKMAGHSFLVPKSSAGRRAAIQGKVLAPEAAGQNECGGKDNCRQQAEAETGKLAKIEIEATGVEFLD